MALTRRPEWLKKRIEFDPARGTSALMEEFGLNTVCREAKCPNISECFRNRHAAFLILGPSCSRRCRFCHVDKSAPQPADAEEPLRIARAAERLGLSHVVVTSVTRDDLPDGGATHFAATVAQLRHAPGVRSIELLIPDLKGDPVAIETIARSRPDIIGHNIETVPRLYDLRPGADYERSLNVLTTIKALDARILTKSAILLGLGETEAEVAGAMEDLRDAGCDFLALGQYLRPSLEHAEVKEYAAPERFEGLKDVGLRMGFSHVESGPYVRSSYRAAAYVNS